MNTIALSSFTFGACCLLLAPLASQSTTVVPADFAATEANSGGSIAGFTERFRQQILVRGDQLQAMQGKQIAALWFRRNETLKLPYLGSTAALQVQVSATVLPVATNPSRQFAANRGPAPLSVFNGLLVLPPTPAPVQPVPWADPYAVRIEFNPTFSYPGSLDLCVEIDGDPQGPPPGLVWMVDYDHEANAGTVTTVEAACGAATGEFVTTANAWSRSIVPGGDLVVATLGWPGTLGIAMFGSVINPGLPLESIKASGCKLCVNPFAQVATLYGQPNTGQTFAPWFLRVPLPAIPALAGGRFGFQAANLEPVPISNEAGITTTNGLEITVSAPNPLGSGKVSVVMSDVVPANTSFPAAGSVAVARGPVMQFEYR